MGKSREDLEIEEELRVHEDLMRIFRRMTPAERMGYLEDIVSSMAKLALSEGRRAVNRKRAFSGTKGRGSR